MGWFNAGTDEREGPPDLFGCVELPSPACCFGPSETQYGPQQRAALLAHLKNEKAQMLPWPPLLKSCFSTAHARVHGLSSTPPGSTAAPNTSAASRGHNVAAPHQDSTKLVNTAPAPLLGLLGSPMLDTALGLVDAVSRAYNEISGEGKSKAGGVGDQFDSMLPPERPTEWVQCEGA